MRSVRITSCEAVMINPVLQILAEGSLVHVFPYCCFLLWRQKINGPFLSFMGYLPSPSLQGPVESDNPLFV